MKFSWIKYAVVFGLVISSGVALMVVSHRVQYVERQIASTDRQIAQEKETIRILDAEWSFLNDPERLEKLAAQYLKLEPPQPEHLVSDVEAAEKVLVSEDVVLPVMPTDAKMYEAAFKPSEIVSVVSSPKPQVSRAKEKLQ